MEAKTKFLERFSFDSLCIVLTVTVVSLLICLPNAFAQENFFLSDPFAGEEIFKTKGCQHCHAIRGQGGDIATDFGWHEYYGNAFELAAELWNHSPTMREIMEELEIKRPVFTENEMAKLMAYLYYQRYVKKTGDVLKGKKLLSEKGCLECHGLRGQGGNVAPRLGKISEQISPLFMAQAMWNHGPEMAKKMQELNIEWPIFKDDEIIDLTNYLRILRKDSRASADYLRPGNPEAGKKLIESKGCLHCHSVQGKGGDIGPDFTQIDFNKSVTEIAALMWNHGAVMISITRMKKIEWPQFKGVEIGDLVSYLYFINFLGQGGDLEQGKKVFKSKGCITCHTKEEGKEPIGPVLSELKNVGSPIQIAQIMWNHAPEMEVKMKELDLEWPQFDKDEMQNLFEFLVNLKEEY